MSVGLVLIAAGYGSLRVDADGVPFAKVLEVIRGIPIFLHPLIAAEKAGVLSSVIVSNPLFVEKMRAQIEKAKASGLIRGTPTLVIQPDRYGSGHAVHCALTSSAGREISRALIAYGDMPLWSHDSIASLLEADSVDRVVTMTTVERGNTYPALDRYGRVLRDGHGNIERIVEFGDATGQEVTERWVNPSLWIWNRNWIEAHIPHVVPVQRPDGRCPEIYLPPLVGMARREGAVIGEVRLPEHRHHEALGVNSRQELDLVRQLHAE